MRLFVAAALLVLALALGVAPAAHAQDEVVAQVGLGAVVTRADFDHWMAIAAKSRKRDAVPAQGTRAWRSLREDEALDRYVHDFHRRWRAVTSCAPGYAMKDCGRTTS